jgi:hypothetical protein
MEQTTRMIPPAGGMRTIPSFNDMEAAEKAGLVIPPARSGGGQEGRVPPALRKISARYEAVDMATASARMADRQKGKLPPIKGGLDGPGEVDERKAHGGNTGLVDQHPSDAPDAAPGPDAPQTVGAADSGSPDAMTMMLRQFMAALTAQTAPLDAFNPPPLVPTRKPLIPNPAPLVDRAAPIGSAVAPREVAAAASPAVAYLAKRSRVGFTVAGGTYSVPVVDVQRCSTGLVILLPVDAQSATFVPSLGAEVAVEYEGKRWECFFPGVAVILDALQVQVLSFVFKDDKQV